MVEPGRTLVDAALLQRFEERIAQDLAERPLQESTDKLRQRVAALLPRLGDASLYELLDVTAGASTEEVYRAYRDLARAVHPSLAERLGVPEGLLRVVFEYVTNAYLVLSDPDRRKDYDRENPAPPVVPQRTTEEIEEAHREMARKNFRRAQKLMLTEEYHYVVELMRDAVHWDPRPEGFALLAEAQGKNPKWRDEAVENLQTAIRMAPRDPGFHLRLALLYEEMQRLPDAIAAFKQVLEISPKQPDAAAGLERLGVKK